jgi:hypothetical protein
VGRRHNEGEQGWWKTKVVLVMPEMEHETTRGLAEMEQVRSRKNEEIEDDTTRSRNVSGREMDVALVAQLFPILNLKYTRCGSQTLDD